MEFKNRCNGRTFPNRRSASAPARRDRRFLWAATEPAVRGSVPVSVAVETSAPEAVGLRRVNLAANLYLPLNRTMMAVTVRTAGSVPEAPLARNGALFVCGEA